MATIKRLGWIGAGYLAAIAAAMAAVRARYWFVNPTDVTPMSGMFAAGDLILFVWVFGMIALIPTYFLLRVTSEHFPRALAPALLALSITGPPCWWIMAAGLSKTGSETLNAILGLSIVFFIGPRAVAGPVVLAVLAFALLLARDPRSRKLLAIGLMVEATPLALVAIHLLRAH